MATGTTSDVLVSTDWVAQHARDTGVRIVEVDVDTTAYGQGHVPGAIGWNWSTELCDTLVRDIVPKGKFERLMSRSGIASDTTVVLTATTQLVCGVGVLADEDLRPPRRAHHERWPEEVAVRQPGPRRPRRRGDADHLSAAAPDSSIRALLPEVQDALKKGTPLVDVRSPQEFTGEILALSWTPETCQRGGHIPGAKSIPWGKACNEDGTFKSTAELEQLYGGAGVTPDKAVIAYCRIGERSSHTWFVLKHLLGYPNVKNHDGSWTRQPGRRAGRKALKASRRGGSGFHTAGRSSRADLLVGRIASAARTTPPSPAPTPAHGSRAVRRPAGKSPSASLSGRPRSGSARRAGFQAHPDISCEHGPINEQAGRSRRSATACGDSAAGRARTMRKRPRHSRRPSAWAARSSTRPGPTARATAGARNRPNPACGWPRRCPGKRALDSGRLRLTRSSRPIRARSPRGEEPGRTPSTRSSSTRATAGRLRIGAADARGLGRAARASASPLEPTNVLKARHGAHRFNRWSTTSSTSAEDELFSCSTSRSLRVPFDAA